MHAYTERLEKGNWMAEISPTTQYGYFENVKTGSGGGLWFEGRELIDYDGVFELPKGVIDMLSGAGYDLTEIIDWDEQYEKSRSESESNSQSLCGND
jgi:hypothetical protein